MSEDAKRREKRDSHNRHRRRRTMGNRAQRGCLICSRAPVMECLLCTKKGMSGCSPRFCSPQCYKEHFAEHKHRVSPFPTSPSESPRSLGTLRRDSTSSITDSWDCSSPSTRSHCTCSPPPVSFQTNSSPLSWWMAAAEAENGNPASTQRRFSRARDQGGFVSLRPNPTHVEVHCVSPCIYLVPMYY